MNELRGDEQLAQSVTTEHKVGVDSRRPCADVPCTEVRVMECAVQFSVLFVVFRSCGQ